MDSIKVTYKAIHTEGKVLNWYKSPDTWFWTHGSVNPYRGCEHDCVYCDGRTEWYGIADFGTLIRIKENAPQRYEKDLLKLGYLPDYRPRSQTIEGFFESSSNAHSEMKAKNQPPRFPVAIGGGVCDVYQPAERKYRVTRSLLVKQRDFGLPTTVLTKSKLVLRDIDLFKEINEMNYASVSFSITLCDESLRKRFEPHATASRQRFKALKEIRENKLHGGVMLMPILPGVGDSEENLACIIETAKTTDAEFILPSGLTLKPGKNKREFINVIQRHFPTLMPLYQELYGNNNRYGIADGTKIQGINISALAHEMCRKWKIPDRMPRYIPTEVYQTNYLVSTVLANLAYYLQWVREEPWIKTKLFIEAGNQIEAMDTDIRELPYRKVRARFKLNEEITDIVREVIETGHSSLLSEFIPNHQIVITGTKFDSNQNWANGEKD
ncbi:MAG: radical SAM protein [Candidatus Thorarchaeota archaeon]